MNDCRPKLSSHLLDERDISRQEERRRLRGGPYRRYDRDGFPRRTFSGEAAVSDQYPDMVDAQAGYGICFRWCRYFIDLRQHRTFASFTFQTAHSRGHNFAISRPDMPEFCL